MKEKHRRFADTHFSFKENTDEQLASILKLLFAKELAAVHQLTSDGRDSNDLHQIKTLPYAASYQLSLNLLVENPEALDVGDKRVIEQWRETSGLAGEGAGILGF